MYVHFNLSLSEFTSWNEFVLKPKDLSSERKKNAPE